ANETRNLVGLTSVASLIVDFVNVWILPFDESEHFHVGNHLVPGPLVAVKRHILDKADFDILVCCKFREGNDFSVIDSSHNHTVDLESYPEALSLETEYFVDGLHDGVKTIPPGHK